VVIISGLARGIDGIAHRAALEGGGRTVAVLAGGFDHLYPPEHRELARQVAARGALISEYPPEQLPQPGLFPVRNRLISGLADGVLVIEAGEKSGALGTAGHALDQGREVLAVPGPVMSPASQGVNRLIQDGAKAVLDVNDIVVEFPSWSLPSGQPAILSWALSGAEKLVMAAIEQGFQTPDLILGQTGLRREEVSRALTALELSGKIRRQAGGLYEPTPFPSR
jgi:DNA processing protein